MRKQESQSRVRHCETACNRRMLEPRQPCLFFLVEQELCRLDSRERIKRKGPDVYFTRMDAVHSSLSTGKAVPASPCH